MSRSGQTLGPVVTAHGTSPATLQRAAIIAIFSFFFFMATLLLFYFRQQLLYFVLASAFLIVYIFTMIGWVLQKRNVVYVHEQGIRYRKFAARWDEIETVKADASSGLTIVKNGGESVTIGKTISEVGRIALLVRQNLNSHA